MPAPATPPFEPQPSTTSGASGGRTRRAPALSPSRANDYVQCPLLFRFRVVDRLPEPPSLAAARGTLVHSVLERLYDLPLGDRTPRAARDLLPGEWSRLRAKRSEYEEMFTDAGERERWLAEAEALVGTYFSLEDPNRLEPQAREVFVETQLQDGPRLRGIIDRLDVAPDGAVRVVDYKTGKSPRPGYEANAAFQMRFYALVLWHERGVVPAMLQLVYLGDGQILRAEPTHNDLELTEEKVRALWGEIVEAAESGRWVPRRTRLCDWCTHQSVCPLFGGTPPDLAEGAAAQALGIPA